MNDLDPRSSPTGVKRLNKLPLVFFILSILIVALSLGYALYQRGQAQKVANRNDRDKKIYKTEADPQNLVKHLMEIAPHPEQQKQEKHPTLLPAPKPPAPVRGSRIPTDNQLRKKVIDEFQKKRKKLEFDAFFAPTKISMGTSIQKTRQTFGFGFNNSPVATPGISAANKLIDAFNQNQAQDRALKNETWLQKAQQASYDYLRAAKVPAISRYELKAGSVIPGILLTGINSELPGHVVGMVSENVYDTVSGKYLLIPQGTRIVGMYNADVVFGQSRVMIAWNRLIFPDGKVLNIGAFEGTDSAGQSGFRDLVDNHYLRIFGSAFLLTLLNGDIVWEDGRPTIKQESTLTARKETALERAAARVIEKNMNVAPTIVIRPGYKFNIFVGKDMILEPIAYVR